MNIKTFFLIVLVVILLTSCAPADSPTTTISTLVTTATKTPSPTETSTPDPRISINFNSETYFVTDKLMYSGNTYTLNIDPLKVRITQSPSIESLVGEILWYTDDKVGTRFIWNDHLSAWVPEFTTSMDYKKPEESPAVPFEAYYDGSRISDPEYAPSSVALSDMLYVAEHPSMIAADASYPYYRVSLSVNKSGPNGYIIALTGPNQYLLTEQNTTKILRNQNKPFAYFGMQQTTDQKGNTIYIIKRASWNPTTENPNGIVTMNMGFDKDQYEAQIQYPLIFKFLDGESHPPGELIPVFPYNYDTNQFSPNTFSYSNDEPNPNVAALLNTSMISMFEDATQHQIKGLIKGYNKPFDAETNPGSYLIPSLPPELSNMILFTSTQSWF